MRIFNDNSRKSAQKKSARFSAWRALLKSAKCAALQERREIKRKPQRRKVHISQCLLSSTKLLTEAARVAPFKKQPMSSLPRQEQLRRNPWRHNAEIDSMVGVVLVIEVFTKRTQMHKYEMNGDTSSPDQTGRDSVASVDQPSAKECVVEVAFRRQYHAYTFHSSPGGRRTRGDRT